MADEIDYGSIDLAPTVSPTAPEPVDYGSIDLTPTQADVQEPVAVEETVDYGSIDLTPSTPSQPSASDTFRKGLGFDRDDPTKPTPIYRRQAQETQPSTAIAEPPPSASVGVPLEEETETARDPSTIAKDIGGSVAVGGAGVPRGAFEGVEATGQVLQKAQEFIEAHPIASGVVNALAPQLSGVIEGTKLVGKPVGKAMEYVGKTSSDWWAKAGRTTRKKLVSEKGQNSKHPAWIISSSIAETTPQLIADYLLGQGVGKVAGLGTSIVTSAIEGNTAGASQKGQVEDTLKAMTNEEISQLPVYQEALKASNGDTKKAREIAVKIASNRAYAETFLTTTLTSLALDKAGAGTLDKWLQDPKVGKIGLKAIMRMAGTEATEEGIQSAFEQMISNKETGEPIFRGVLQAMGYGAATGAILGSALTGGRAGLQSMQDNISGTQSEPTQGVDAEPTSLPPTLEQAPDTAVEPEAIATEPEATEPIDALQSLEQQLTQKLDENRAKPPAERLADSQTVNPMMTDPTADTKQRKFLGRSADDTTAPKEVIDALRDVEPQTYEVHKTSQELETIRGWIAEDPKNKSEAEARVLSDEPMSATKTVLAVALLEEARNSENVEEEVRLTEHMDKQLREAGRSIQAASFWAQQSGKAWMRTFDNLSKEKGIAVDSQTRQQVATKFADANKLKGQARTDALSDAIEFASVQLPLKFGEKLDAWRYANMLSNPRTHLRNSAFNTITTFAVRPLSLLHQGQFKGAGTYLKNSAQAMGDAGTRFMEVMRGGDSATSKEMEIYANMSALELARQKQAPKIARWVGDFLNAQDQLFGTMIKAGESARLMKQGVPESKAEEEAADLSTRYLLRKTIGQDTTNTDMPALIRALDGLGKIMEDTRKIKGGIGKASGWFIPFIRTPINWAKLGVQSSPLGLTKKPKRTSTESDLSYQQRVESWHDRQGLATAGSGFVLIGAMLAQAGLTTWEPPRDKESREAFYASGRKPYSILVNGKWVPMWYLGPFAFAVAIPAAFRDAMNDNPDLASKNWGGKMMGVAGGLARFYTSQTPLQGLNNALKIMSGDVDAGFGKTLGFTAGQAIPGSGMIRYVNTIIDPRFRKATNFFESMKKDLPVLSKQLKPHTLPTGEPATRVMSDYTMPFTLGTENKQFESLYQDRNNMLKNRRANDDALDDLIKRVSKGKVPDSELWIYIMSRPTSEQGRLKSRLKREDEEAWTRLGFGSQIKRTRRSKRKR